MVCFFCAMLSPTPAGRRDWFPWFFYVEVPDWIHFRQPWRWLHTLVMMCAVVHQKHHMHVSTRSEMWFSSEFFFGTFAWHHANEPLVFLVPFRCHMLLFNVKGTHDVSIRCTQYVCITCCPTSGTIFIAVPVGLNNSSLQTLADWKWDTEDRF